MAQPNATAEIQTLINDFATQLSALVRQTTLDQIRSVLEGGTTTTGTASTTRATTGSGKTRTVKVVRLGRAKKGGRRSAEDVTAMGQTLLDYVKKNPGQRGEQIAKALRTDVGTMRLPMKALISAKKVKTKGQRRGMTYFAS